MLRVLIADNHPIVRAGLRHVCEREADLQVTGDCSSDEVLKAVRTHPWDILIVGIGYPTIYGFDVISQVKAVRPDATILVFSVYPDEQFALRALRAGAAGYLMKEAELAEIVTVLRRVAAGVRYVRPDFAQKIVLEETAGARTSHRHDALSAREFQVLTLIASGRSLVEIAEALSLSVKTVSTFRSRILNKLRVKNTAELMMYAIQAGLIQVPDSPA